MTDKFEIGDEIYFIRKNRIMNAEIVRIHVEIDENGTNIFYGFIHPDYDNIRFVREDRCHCSKESLLKSL